MKNCITYSFSMPKVVDQKLNVMGGVPGNGGFDCEFCTLEGEVMFLSLRILEFF